MIWALVWFAFSFVVATVTCVVDRIFRPDKEVMPGDFILYFVLSPIFLVLNLVDAVVASLKWFVYCINKLE